METKVGLNLTLFSSIYTLALFLELVFNREFLAGVIPIGMASNLPLVERIFSYMFFIGAFAFGLVLILQPIIIGVTAYVSNLNRPSKVLLWTVLYLSILLDAIHLYIGVNNSFNPPPIFSLFYLGLIIASILTGLIYLRSWVLPFLFIPVFLAYGTLIGDWLILVTKSSVFGVITATCGELMAYSVMLSGGIFVYYSIRRGISILGTLIFLFLGIIVGSIVFLNLIPGLGIMIGVMFPYIFGILGVKDWMPPIIFAIGVLGFGSGWLLYKKDPAMSLSTLSLFFGSLVFDTVDTTVYLMLPLSALAIQLMLKSVLKDPETNRR
ncbi:MAG: hypothetical protein QXD10_06080 [Metallosphaera sp.]|uniref:hypothetical protein n=1 Tax=Metallosphaera sp. TaxID=2020860 RepID=UPI003162AB97